MGLFPGIPCSDCQIHPLKSRIAAAMGLFPGIPCSDCQVYPLKSGIAAAMGLFPGIPCSDSQVDPLKSRIAAAMDDAGVPFSFATTKIRIGRGTRCSHGCCRRNHSPLLRRRLESDANVVAVTPAAGGTITPVCLRRHPSGDTGVARRVSAPQKKEPLTCVRGSLRCGRDSSP